MAGTPSSSTTNDPQNAVRDVWSSIRVPVLWAVGVALLARACLGLIAPSVAWFDPSEAHPAWGRGVAVLLGLAALGLLGLVHGRASRVRLRAPGLWIGVVLGGVLMGRALALADEGWTFWPPVTFEYTLFLASMLLPVLGGLASMVAIANERKQSEDANQARTSPVGDHVKTGVGAAAVLGLGLWGFTVQGPGLVLDWLHILTVALMTGLGVAWWARSTSDGGNGKALGVGFALVATVYAIATVSFAFYEGETDWYTAYFVVHGVLVGAIGWLMGKHGDRFSPVEAFWDALVAIGTGFSMFAVYLAIRAQALAEKVQAAEEPLFSPVLEVVGLIALLAACAYAVRGKRGRS